MKRTKYPIHPDFKKWTHMNPPLNGAILPMMQRLIRLLFMKERSTADMIAERKVIPVGSGDTIRALWYCPKDVGENAPCLVYVHGGGFVWPASPHHYSLAREYAQRARCKVLFVDYLRDGGILYAKRLQEFGVPTELYNTEGTMHGFDIVLNSSIVRKCVDRRVAFLKKVFAGNQ